MVDVRITTNAVKVEAQFKALNTKLVAGRNSLLLSVSRALRANVKERIASQDGGQWAPPSKWLRAKGKQRALSGAGQYVKARVTGGAGQVYAELPPSNGDPDSGLGAGQTWSLTQHHKGFNNRPPSNTLVIIPLRVPQALNLKPGRKHFAFIEKRQGKTPARQIWPTRAQAHVVMAPIASRWLKKIAEKV